MTDIEGLRAKYNLVDLAEVPIKQGSIIPGMLLRSGSLDSMDVDDWKTIRNLSPLGLWVDLRSKNEIPVLPLLYHPEIRQMGCDCGWAHVPLEGLRYFIKEKHRSNPRRRDWKAARKFLWSDPETNLAMMYRFMLESPENIAGWRRFFGYALAPRRGGMLWQCAQGTDRTGLTTALVLDVLGASRDAILENYGKCMIHPGLKDNKTVAMDEALWYLDRDEGGISGYLEHRIGLTDRDKRALLERFVG